MKPITHPLAIAFVEERASGRSGLATKAWIAKGMPLYDGGDPTPMPAPALGMRVWFEHTHPSGGTVTHSEDMRDASPGEWWGENVNKIVIITDFRTGEVIWRRS